MSDAKKAEWKSKAKSAKQQHTDKHPNYKFKPIPKVLRRFKRTHTPKKLAIAAASVPCRSSQNRQQRLPAGVMGPKRHSKRASITHSFRTDHDGMERASTFRTSSVSSYGKTKLTMPKARYVNSIPDVDGNHSNFNTSTSAVLGQDINSNTSAHARPGMQSMATSPFLHGGRSLAESEAALLLSGLTTAVVSGVGNATVPPDAGLLCPESTASGVTISSAGLQEMYALRQFAYQQQVQQAHAQQQLHERAQRLQQTFHKVQAETRAQQQAHHFLQQQAQA